MLDYYTLTNFSLQTWECHFQHTVKKHITILALPWLPVDPDKVQNYSYLRHNLILGFADGHIRTLNRYRTIIAYFDGKIILVVEQCLF